MQFLTLPVSFASAGRGWGKATLREPPSFLPGAQTFAQRAQLPAFRDQEDDLKLRQLLRLE